MSVLNNLILDDSKNFYIPLGEAGRPTAGSDIADQIHEVLIDRTIGGAVLTGVAGNSRQSAFESAFARLQGKVQLVRLNGISFALNEPRGALSFLISRIDIAAEASRHELVHALAALLCPEGCPAVMLLGHPELIDDQSASILSQLSAMRKIVLIVSCERLHDLPQDLLSFYRSGQLSHIHMPSLALAQARSCLEQELGGPLSTLAVSTLRYLTNSNRDLMLRLARIWLAEKQLEQHRGFWILRSGVLKMGPALTAMLNVMLSALQTPERNLLFVMAIGGPIPVDVLHRNGMARQLDELAGSGSIRIVQHPVKQAVIDVPLFSLLLREVVDDDILMSLEAELSKLHRDPVAAQTDTAMRSMEDQGKTGLLLEIAEAFRENGYTPASWVRDPEHRVAILSMHVKALLALHRVPDATSVLDQAEAAIGSVRRYPDVADRLELAQREMEILRVRVMMAGGGRAAVSDARNTLRALCDSIAWRSESQHYRVRAAQIVDWAVHRRQRDALAAVEQIGSELSRLKANGQFDVVFSTEDAAELELMMLQTQLLAGSWHAASRSAHMLVENQLMKPQIVASVDAVQGILHGFFDDPVRALRILNPVLQQLAFVSEPVERAAAEAVVAFALVTMGDNADAIELLLKEPDAALASLPLTFLSWVAEAFSSMALARINEPKYAYSRLNAFAEKLRDVGYTGLELHTLAIALRLGNFDVSDRFEHAARGCQGRIARRYADLAQTLSHQQSSELRSSELLIALEGLVESGQMILSTPSPNALIEVLEPREQRRLATAVLRQKRQINGIYDENLSETSQKDGMPSWTSVLTRREFQFALLAIDGQGNSEIARNSGVSIRTVEGHLYQVYSKLQVRNRQELTTLARETNLSRDKT